jgi:6-pyruvoyltetrahydropterin/6-carboxytetrahydropterin synthase
MTVEVRGGMLFLAGPQAGMILDYGQISLVVQPLLETKLDHWHLNDTTTLESPTSEALAQWIYGELVTVLPGLYAVIVEETCTSRCRYEPD